MRIEWFGSFKTEKVSLYLHRFVKLKRLKIYHCCHTYIQGIKVLREIEEYAKTFQIC
jgi:hypothetical protein